VFPLLRMCVLGVVVFSTVISAAWAADRTVTLRLGAGSALTLERPFKTVLVGDPDIVNVHTHSDRLVILEPLHPGETNLVFVDEASIAIANIRIVVSGASAVPINYRDGIAFPFRSNSDIRKREDGPLRGRGGMGPRCELERSDARLGAVSPS
jgi:hypothetical protein